MIKLRNALLIFLFINFAGFGWALFAVTLGLAAWTFFIGVITISLITTELIMLFAMPDIYQERAWEQLSTVWNKIIKPKGD